MCRRRPYAPRTPHLLSKIRQRDVWECHLRIEEVKRKRLLDRYGDKSRYSYFESFVHDDDCCDTTNKTCNVYKTTVELIKRTWKQNKYGLDWSSFRHLYTRLMNWSWTSRRVDNLSWMCWYSHRHSRSRKRRKDSNQLCVLFFMIRSSFWKSQKKLLFRAAWVHLRESGDVLQWL